MPNLLAAIGILILGWIVARAVAFGVRGLLKRTQLDNRLAAWIMGQRPGEKLPQTERWVAAAVYWIILAFVLVAVLNALQLQAVSEPLNRFLGEIFVYLPRLGGTLVLLGVGWAVATVARLAVIQGLRRFNLDERLAQPLQPEAAAEGTAAKPEGGAEVAPFLLNEALGDALYWLVLLFFLPLILDTLNLRGPLQPVQNLLDQILSMVPRILGAVVIGVLGWFLARIVRGGANRLGARFGIPQLAQTVGTVAYVLVLIPAVIAALKALEIRAISDPAVAMLEQVLRAIPRIAGSALILAVFYWLGQFLAGLVTQLLQAIGFDRLAAGLGLPSAPAPEAPAAEGDPSALAKRRTPSEIAGLVVWVGVVLFGAVPAVELLQFAALTDIVQGLLLISGRVLIGALVFGIGLYLANLAHSMIKSLGNPSSGVLAQAARAAILVFVGAMALQQMGVATDIVVLAFGLVLGAIAVAVALAFGLGGRDVAAEQIRQWLKRE